MLPLFTIAIFVSACLLFLVQPLTGKLLLPLLGGSPAVWNTCMVFFQGVLLLGYGYSHIVSKRLSERAQVAVHALVLLAGAAALFVPLEIGTPVDANPTLWLLKALTLRVGMPFFVVSTSGPLLQRWFSRTGHQRSADPYFLYVASNAGSVVGLLAYPLALEPLLTRPAQQLTWNIGYVALIGLVVACGAAMLPRAMRAGAAAVAETAPPPPWRRRLRWVVLALIPSSLMLGVTQHISTDIAAVPLLWIVPLMLYLVTLMMAFSKHARIPAKWLARALPPLVIATAVSLLLFAHNPISVLIPLHLLTFFVAALMCHTLLADDRPAPAHLTEFYLWMSVGGVAGGLINALAAPLLFNSLIEYPLMIAAACFARPQVLGEGFTARRGLTALATTLALALLVLVIDGLISGGKQFKESLLHLDQLTQIKILRAGVPPLIGICLLLGRGSLRFAGAALVLLCAPAFIATGGSVVYQERTFFGVYAVTVSPGGGWTELRHGTTLHGRQIRNDIEDPGAPEPDQATVDAIFFARGPMNLSEEVTRARCRYLIPSTYYHPTGPIGDVMKLLGDKGELDQCAFIGLGAGSLASYARPGSAFIFFEIDPAVVGMAFDPRYFSYISHATRRTDVKIGAVTGDGRINIAKPETGPHRLIVLDAFSSDAIPIHLLTVEAFGVYLSRLKDDGVIAVHISNRYFDLAPVVGRIAERLHLAAYIRHDEVTETQKREGKTESDWVILARDKAHLGSLAHMPLWETLKADPRAPLWTDDFSNIVSVFGHTK